MAANLGESQIRCVFVETNLDTRLGVRLREDDTSSDFKDNLCKAHQQCFPEIGEIKISAIKIKRRNHLYHCPDSINLSKAFEGINGDWYLYVDAVRFEKCELLSIMGAAEQNRSNNNNELLQRENEIAVDTNGLSYGGGLGTEVVAERTTKKRKTENSDVKKCRKRYLVDLSDASRYDVCESQELCGKVEVEVTKEDTRVASGAQILVADYDNQPMKVVENCDGIFGGCKDLASRVEDCEPAGKCVQNVENTKEQKSDKKLEVDEVEGKTKRSKRKGKEKKNSFEDNKTDNVDEQKDDVSVPRDEEKPELDGEKHETFLSSSGAEGVDKVVIKTKKRKSKEKKKSCENHKTDNVDEQREDLSVPRDEEKPEFDGEKIETSLSRSGLICNNVALGAASLETRDLLPRCSCHGPRTRKLVVFDLNGILIDVVQGYRGHLAPDGNISGRAVFRRPFVASFLDFCFERFDVGIWSSRRIGLDYMTGLVMENRARNLLFCFDQHICITTKFNTLENSTKPLFLKDLRRVWNSIGTCLTCGKRKYDETNTLLVDDSPHKALCNPPHTGIFPRPYQFTDRNDSDLGPNGELRKYMERLADAENVQKFVEENPIGQTVIDEAHKSWGFYSKVIEAYK